MEQNWWKERVIYQIYPRSFMDSNGDGIGDLNGIISKLDYLQELGVGAIWLSPVYCSPNDDNGYDISDYQDIMPEFGTMEDWERLKDGCHKRDIKIIMDLVVNHSSDEHQWFIESSSSRTNPKSDYYIWHDPVEGKEPNNWGCAFGGSAWEYCEARGQYYLHLFSKKQPDLNWFCKELREQIYQMMEWWVLKGVDGFRVDAISYLDKPEDFPDSPETPDSQGFAFCMGMLAGREKTHQYIREMNEGVFSKYQVMSVGEVAAPDIEELKKYVLTDRKEFSMAIPFVPPIVEINTWSIRHMRETFWERYAEIAPNGWWAQFLSNHDKPRQVSLYGNDGQYREQSAKQLALLLHTVPGTPFIFQGEELGMTNICYPSIEDYDDIDTRNFYQEQIASGMSAEDALKLSRQVSRDNARTPMQWDNTAHAGFTTGIPWLAVNPNYPEINVYQQLGKKGSILSFYQRLIRLRKDHPIMVYGNFKLVDLGSPEQVIAYSRTYQGITWLAVHNLTMQPASLGDKLTLPEPAQIILSSYECEGGYQIQQLRPFESVILEIKADI